MNRRIRSIALSALAAGALALPATAGAATTDPTSLSFGSQAVGTTSPVKNTTLTTNCLSVVVTCLSLPTDTVNVSIATTGDFVATTACPASLAPSLLGAPASCTIGVAFRPTAAGARTGTLSTGTVGVLVPTAGPTVALSGSGVQGSSATVGKKCKKKKGHKRSASSAKKKKCKKHKKHKKHNR